MASTTDPTQSSPLTDNFYSPANYDFYAHQPYQHLDKDSNAIRLIRVSKTERGELQCRLIHNIPLAKAADTFTAISYCAGDPKQTRTIQVDGLSFNAFANLAYAIEQTYQHCSTTSGANDFLLWADQICINQSDLPERSHQVGYMHQIYQSAHEVVVCLSTDHHPGGDAFAWIEEAHTQLSDSELGYDPGVLDPTNLQAEDSFTRWFWSLLYNEAFVPTWLDVLQMLQQPWWSRTWVCQEYISGQHVKFVYGAKAVSEAVFRKVLNKLIALRRYVSDSDAPSNADDKSKEYVVSYGHLQKVFFFLEDLRRRFHRAGCMMAWRQTFREEQSLLHLLVLGREAAASDARDYIYAFLGIAATNYGIVADYSEERDYVDVFTEAARKIISLDRSLRILYSKEAYDVTRSARLPSWVPDWTSCEKQLVWYDYPKHITCYATSWPGSVSDASFAEDGKVLEISGIYMDTLVANCPKQLTPPLPPYYFLYWSQKEYKIASSHAARPGDQIWILYGGTTPFILRPEGPVFRLINGADAHVGKPTSEQEARWEERYNALRQTEPLRIRII